MTHNGQRESRRALVTYASTHGHTARIAARLADHLRSHDMAVDLVRVEDAGETDPRDYDLVVVGASIHVGHHQRTVVDWVKRHVATLNMTPSAFFSVSLTAAEDSHEAREVTAKLVNDFEEETGWKPQAAVTMAGALQYREYDFFTRLVIRMIARHHGQSTDTSHDVDYTDWDAVSEFAGSISSLKAGGTEATTQAAGSASR